MMLKTQAQFFCMKSVITVCWFMCFSAEFVISLAEKHPNIDAFKSVLVKNGADFTVRIFFFCSFDFVCCNYIWSFWDI